MALKKLMDNYFLGKPGKRDLTPDDIPKTRGELFKTVLKVRLTSLFGPNFFFVISCLPAAVWVYLNALLALGMLQEEGGASGIPSLLLTCLLILFPLITITGPFSMGLAFVMRNWARDEHAFAFSDFKDAMRANWKQGLLYGLISGLVPLIAGVSTWFYLQMAESSFVFYIPMAVILMIVILWGMTAQLLPTMLVTYDQRFFAQLKNALLITLLQLPKALGIRLITLVVPIILGVLIALFPGSLSVITTIGVALYLLIVPALHALIVAAYANDVCEKYLNSRIAGARVNIGLRDEGGVKGD